MRGNVMIQNPEGTGYLMVVGPPEPDCHFKDWDGWKNVECRRSIAAHRHPTIRHQFDGGPADPAPWEMVAALAHTEWTCPHCGYNNDVWGEGAIYTWMECVGCQREMYLSLDLYLQDC